MEWGQFGDLLDALDEDDRPRAPGLPDWLLWIWRAWHRLTHDRPWRSGGMGPPMPGRIPWSLVREWCDHHGYDEDDMDLLDRGLAALDAVFLEHWAAVARRNAKGDKP